MADDIESLPFHRKYRPNTLKGYIGNQKIKETAMKALMSDKKPQVILLWGSSGCGKTTFARLLAKEYSCEDRDPETGACDTCYSCQMINDYIATGNTDMLQNIQEIDITEQSGKRDLSAVLNDMTMPSYAGEWRTYILDECHMASEGLQNRLLKIAEETPENVLIIFCTTNPEKMIPTLQNRCNLKLHVTKPKVKELVGLLKHVCECEQVEYDTEGLEFIANRGELTIRTALQNLQQVVNEQHSAKYDNVIKVFDAISSTLITSFFRALKNKDVFRYISLLYEVKSKFDLQMFVNELRAFVQRGVYTINGIVLDGVTANDLKVYKDLFGDLGVAQISYLINRITSMNANNLEMSLMLLGYTGLDVPIPGANPSENVFASKIETPDREVAREGAMATQILKEKQEVEREQGIANSAKLMEEVSMEDVLSGFGGVMVVGE